MSLSKTTGPALPLLLTSFFFNDTATTEIYTLSLHDALPIYRRSLARRQRSRWYQHRAGSRRTDRKSTRLNSSHANISYAVFCLKKKTRENRALFSLHRCILADGALARPKRQPSTHCACVM